MLVSKYKSAGFTLIEAMVAIGIMAIILSAALPSFRGMLLNSQVRNAAESVVNGMQKARAEAVSRNRNVEFVLDSSTSNSWTVRLAVAGATIESRVSGEGSANVVTATLPANATTVTFNNLGGVVEVAPLTQVNLSAVGANRSLQVRILQVELLECAIPPLLLVIQEHVNKRKIMNKQSSLPLKSTQQGVVLLEALIAVLIFSMGILALVGLQATMIKSTTGSKFRSDASYIAQQRIGRIWADPANAATYVVTNQTIPELLPNGMVTISQPQPSQFRVIVGWTEPGETATAGSTTSTTCGMTVAHCFTTVASIAGG